MQLFFAYSWKLPAYSGAFLLTVDNFSFFAYNWSCFAYNLSFFTYNWSFFAYNGKVCLIRALRDCKQRSLTVSKKVPTASRKASPILRSFIRDLKGGLVNSPAPSGFTRLPGRGVNSCSSALCLTKFSKPFRVPPSTDPAPCPFWTGCVSII